MKIAFLKKPQIWHYNSIFYHLGTINTYGYLISLPSQIRKSLLSLNLRDLSILTTQEKHIPKIIIGQTYLERWSEEIIIGQTDLERWVIFSPFSGQRHMSNPTAWSFHLKLLFTLSVIFIRRSSAWSFILSSSARRLSVSCCRVHACRSNENDSWCWVNSCFSWVNKAVKQKGQN